MVMSDLVTALIRAQEVRDAWLAEHSLRVSCLAKLLAETLNLGSEFAEEVACAGYLHDLGMLGVSENVLARPGSLTEPEIAEVRRHPELGFQILDRLQTLPQSVALAVLHHHERWDGSGYPRGLKGESIPLASFMINLAESWDVMTHNLPYRDALAPAEARERILRAAGKQFHPELAGVFCDLPVVGLAR